MDKVRILAITPDPGMEQMFLQIASSRNDIEIRTVMGNITNWRQALDRYPRDSFDVVISRGGTARKIRSSTDLSVVEIRVSLYDMLCSLKNAEHYTGRIAIVGFSNVTESAAQLTSVMGYDTTILELTEYSDVKKELLQLKSQGYDLFLGDYITYRNASSLGLTALLITSGEKSLRDAVDEAVQLVTERRSTRAENYLLRSMLQQEWDAYAVFTESGTAAIQSAPFFTGTEEGSGSAEGSADNTALIEQVRSSVLHLQSDFETVQFDWNHSTWLLNMRRLYYGSEAFITCCLKKNTAPFFPSGKGITLKSREDLSAGDPIDTLISASVKDTIRTYAASSLPVLILGETGTGHDSAARMLYLLSNASDRGFVTLDCRVITDKEWNYLISSEQSPLFENGYTFYLQNVELLSANTAQKICEFLDQTNCTRRCRIFASCVRGRNVKEDDYLSTYLKSHFSTILLRLPALRSCREDIYNLEILCINRMNSMLGKQVIGLTPEASELLHSFDWNENLVQFERVIRTLVLGARTPYITQAAAAAVLKEEGPSEASSLKPGCASVNLRQPLSEIEYDVIRMVLEEEGGNQSRTAVQLGIGRSTLWAVMKRHR